MSSDPALVVTELTDPADLEQLRALWLALHAHHREVVPSTPLQPDDEVSWRARSATYERWLEADDAVVLVAKLDGTPVGYAVAHVESGADDDTFDFGETYADLYTLSVLPGHRGQSIGSALLDALGAHLRARSVETLTVSAMAGNSRALDFYRRRGFEPLEASFVRRLDA